MPILTHAPLILASGSAIRQQLMKSVGLAPSVEPSGVDEEALARTVAHLPMPERALALARAKALSVGVRHPDAYTIGADQVCAIGDEVLNKPITYDAACDQLARLSGKTHTQNCGVAIAHGGQIIWEHAAVAHLTLRTLGPEEIRAYIAADAPLKSCGAYKFESLGRHLFAAVEGDHDVITGLPMVPLLAKLHELKIISIA